MIQDEHVYGIRYTVYPCQILDLDIGKLTLRLTLINYGRARFKNHVHRQIIITVYPISHATLDKKKPKRYKTVRKYEIDVLRNVVRSQASDT